MNKTIRRDVTIEDCVLLIAWAAFFLPPIIPRISSAASHALSLAGYAAFLVLLIYRKKEFPVKTDVLLYLVFLGYCILILILKSPEKFPLIARRNLLPAFTSIFLIKWTFDRNPRGLGLLYHLCSFYMYFNFLTLILYPDGIIKSSIGSSVERAQWLLGSKNNIPLYMILFTTIAAYYYYTVRRTRALYVLIVIAMITIIMSGEDGREFMEGSSTGIAAYAATVMLFAYYLHGERTRTATVSAKVIFVLVMVMSFVLVTGQSVPGMDKIIVGVFHKELSFTGRTFIWNNNLSAVAQNPIFGHGDEGVIAHTLISNVWQSTEYTYNLILKLLMNYGIVGFGLFLAMILRIERGHETSDCILFSGFIGLMIIGMMNEISMEWLLFIPVSLISFQRPMPPVTSGRAGRIPVRPRKSLGLRIKF